MTWLVARLFRSTAVKPAKVGSHKAAGHVPACPTPVPAKLTKTAPARRSSLRRSAHAKQQQQQQQPQPLTLHILVRQVKE
eukprot:1156678-Pelagomonas_calceolata.AAC.3